MSQASDLILCQQFQRIYCLQYSLSWITLYVEKNPKLVSLVTLTPSTNYYNYVIFVVTNNFVLEMVC